MLEAAWGIVVRVEPERRFARARMTERVEPPLLQARAPVKKKAAKEQQLMVEHSGPEALKYLPTELLRERKSASRRLGNPQAPVLVQQRAAKPQEQAERWLRALRAPAHSKLREPLGQSKNSVRLQPLLRAWAA